MSEVTDSRTSVSLLGVLHQDPCDPRAWDEFVLRYRPKIYGWCCGWGLQGADAEDVAQDVLAKLTEAMRHFHYDSTRSFRAWLKTVTQRTLCDFVATWRRGTGRGDDSAYHALESLEARVDLERRLEQAFDHEILEIAKFRVRERVAPATWEAFRLTAFEGLSGIDASRHLVMPVANVFMAKHRVRKMLQDEIRKLEGPDDE
jgi:RNA polymerase sigma-70 factor (ECF subfamily)